jgi:hypothetical protein
MHIWKYNNEIPHIVQLIGANEYEKKSIKIKHLARCQWLTLITLAPWEAEIRRILV